MTAATDPTDPGTGYLTVRHGVPSARQLQVGEDIIVDLTGNGRVVGVESLSGPVRLDQLARVLHVTRVPDGAPAQGRPHPPRRSPAMSTDPADPADPRQRIVTERATVTVGIRHPDGSITQRIWLLDVEAAEQVAAIIPGEPAASTVSSPEAAADPLLQQLAHGPGRIWMFR